MHILYNAGILGILDIYIYILTETCVIFQVIARLAGTRKGSHIILADSVETRITVVALVHILTGLIVELKAGLASAGVRSVLVEAFARSAWIHAAFVNI